ncbi:hypothetical protein ADK57_24910 [Streptomyces sp. MMG1533]|uniref:hypothetical protein n=1 Tax=Streptomyces sp. MMG1533 TaxID=1415546 RepID=UPI0006C47665|nr:hypothetical protein [Streptomyces sp. MMG1533]KOU62383.1 hypothetical protein ADK57_24910 [Streptomyces sp. MMG1533]
MTAGWGSRTVRAAVFAAVCVLLAALGHVMMSGSHVSAWVLAVGFAATVSVGWRLAGRERGLPLIVVVVVAVQTLLHSAFSLAQSASGAPAGGSTASDTGFPHMGSGDVGSAHTGSMHMDGMGSMDMSHMGHSAGGGTSEFGMLAAHLLAALLCGLWLAHGERAAFRILRAVAGWLAAPLRLLLALPAAPDRPRLRGRRLHPDRAPRLLLLVHAITSRGPPLGTAVV